MTIERVQSAVETEQAERRREGKFFKQHRLGEYPGEPNIAVDVYGGPRGVGYAIREHRRQGGVPQVRCENHGPEAWREHGWRDLEESP